MKKYYWECHRKHIDNLGNTCMFPPPPTPPFPSTPKGKKLSVHKPSISPTWNFYFQNGLSPFSTCTDILILNWRYLLGLYQCLSHTTYNVNCSTSTQLNMQSWLVKTKEWEITVVPGRLWHKLYIFCFVKFFKKRKEKYWMSKLFFVLLKFSKKEVLNVEFIYFLVEVFRKKSTECRNYLLFCRSFQKKINLLNVKNQGKVTRFEPTTRKSWKFKSWQVARLEPGHFQRIVSWVHLQAPNWVPHYL
jgi:hypothetical protein